ncbi:MAG: oligosaccharide flippase family protein [Crocinitomicaceae bacterium]
MSSYLEKFKNRSDFTRNIVKLISGTALAQIISILISPILTRIYSPEEFGAFTILVSIYGMLALVTGGRYEVAILLPKRKGEASNLMVLSLFFNLIFSIFVFVVLFVLDYFWIDNKLGIWYYLIPVFVFLVGFVQILNTWFNRRKMYNEIAVNKISSSLFTNGFSLFFGFLKMNFNGLMGGALVASLVNFLVVLYQIKKDFQYVVRTSSLNQLKKLATEYKRFPLVNSFQSVLDATQINGLIYIISGLFGQLIVGVFSLSLRILLAPMNFIGGAISQVFYQEASDRYNQDKPLMPLVNRTLKQTGLLISVVLLVLLFFGPQLFAFVFGERWREAGVYAQILSPWVCLDFVRAPLSQIPLIFKQQNQMLIFTVFSNLIILFIAILIGFYFENMKTMLLVLTFCQVVYLLLLILWFYKSTIKYDKTLR